MSELKKPLKESPSDFTITSFISISSPCLIFEALKNCFISDNTLYEHTKNKIYGYARNNGEIIYFLITVFDNKNSEFLIQFQRLNGCCISFNKFYYNTLKNIFYNNIIFIRRAYKPRANIESFEDILPLHMTLKYDIPICNGKARM